MGVPRVGLFLLVAVALCAGQAAAQERGVEWSLLKPPDFAAEYARGYETGQRLAADRAAAEDRRGREARARAVGRLIAAGRCDEARAFALVQGDLDLATRVSAYCAAR